MLTLARRILMPALLVTGMSVTSGAHAPRPPIVGAVYWPGADGRTVHGFMAVPARARGRQPAVIVLGDGTRDDPIARYMLERLATAGLVACAPTRIADGGAVEAAHALADARATLRWLGTNRYATGRVGVLGFGRGAALAARLAGDDTAPAGVVIFGGVSPGTTSPAIPLLVLPPYDRSRSASVPDDATDAAARDFTRAADFLKEHLT